MYAPKLYTPKYTYTNSILYILYSYSRLKHLSFISLKWWENVPIVLDYNWEPEHINVCQEQRQKKQTENKDIRDSKSYSASFITHRPGLRANISSEQSQSQHTQNRATVSAGELKSLCSHKLWKPKWIVSGKQVHEWIQLHSVREEGERPQLTPEREREKPEASDRGPLRLHTQTNIQYIYGQFLAQPIM